MLALWLMARRGLTAPQAVTLLRQQRPAVCINPGFLTQLWLRGGRQGSLRDVLEAQGLTEETMLEKFSSIAARDQVPSHVEPADGLAAGRSFVVPSAARAAVWQLRPVRVAEVACDGCRVHFDVQCSANDAGSTGRQIAAALGLRGAWAAGRRSDGTVRFVFVDEFVADAASLEQMRERVSVVLVTQPAVVVEPLDGAAWEHCSIFPPPLDDAPLSPAPEQLRTLAFLNQAGRDAAEALSKRYSVNVARHSAHRELHQLTYGARNSMLDDPVVSECRGLVVERVAEGHWRAVALPFVKFFNIGDTRAREFDWSRFTTSEKLDGMMIMLYWYAEPEGGPSSHSRCSKVRGRLACGHAERPRRLQQCAGRADGARAVHGHDACARLRAACRPQVHSVCLGVAEPQVLCGGGPDARRRGTHRRAFHGDVARAGLCCRRPAAGLACRPSLRFCQPRRSAGRSCAPQRHAM